MLLITGARSTASVARLQLSIDISGPHDAQQQTRRPPLLLSIDGTDRRTDRRTPDRYIDPAVRPMRARAVSINMTDTFTTLRLA